MKLYFPSSQKLSTTRTFYKLLVDAKTTDWTDGKHDQTYIAGEDCSAIYITNYIIISK